MKTIEKGHIYDLTIRSHDGTLPAIKVGDAQTLKFVNKQPGQEHDGVTTQEVLRVLLDRARHCANCMPHRNNEQIIYHLRMALVLHEARALERKLEKGLIAPEYISTGPDGHYELSRQLPDALDTPVLDAHRNDWDRPCNHPVVAAPVKKSDAPRAQAKPAAKKRKR